ncbi:glycoside hydrolase family 43 protein [Pseudoruegeria sp. SHC-113]|uniref:glycoside hydrolase family 43 protein n=1 Tax=Pseudoruegeria sp. SHC-113 TaxID=2855439 RepID=UPI0021BA5CE6|nr:glycoside hydrolase family 43 protein [Pseudoruegeria sp. SHC-113]MCT8160824.1 glycoside hydrolase family 43 protein [Pseudoruegeria sp. SHC-113]
MADNPILRGFNPDPSICRAGSTYYIATSTFEWYPGVRIYRSEDLDHWEIAAMPLDRASQLDMRGNPDSGGIWAPCLSYADGLFWLVYTDVKRMDGNYKDAHNYVVTAPSIEGPWSDPVYLNSSGFDPSLFHDDDGRKWLLNEIWDHRGTQAHRDPPRGLFGGIVAQEYSPEEGRLIGERHTLYHGSPLGMTEGAHLFKHAGRYYLCTAEGGTGYEHAVTYSRADALTGPYETHPEDHVLTARFAPENALQRVGHGQLVSTPDGRWFHTFLCGRPLPGRNQCQMGRETGLEEVEWRADGWLYRKGGGMAPSGSGAPIAEDVTFPFAQGPLPMDFQWPRSPEADRLFSFTARPGWLRLFGREGLGSWFEQALVARRQTEAHCSAEVELEFTPADFQAQAGLTAYYNRHKLHYLCLSRGDDGAPVLMIQSCAGDWPEGGLSFPIGDGIAVPEGPLALGLDIRGAVLQFRYRLPGGAWQEIGPELDAGVLSDEGGRGEHSSFTGTFLGMAAQDLSGRAAPADFRNFRYRSGAAAS